MNHSISVSRGSELMYNIFLVKRIVVLLLLVGVISTPLFGKGFYTSHDGETHLIRAVYFAHDLSSGVLVPRWQPELSLHQGYPIFTFTYPLPYYFTSLFILCGVSAIDSLKLVFLTATFISVLGYWWLVTIVTKKPAAGLAAASLFIFVPYRFLDLYVRAALGELVFLMMLPFICVLLLKRQWISAGFCVGLAILSHLQLSAIFLPIVIILVCIWNKSLRPVLSALSGLALSAYFWVPAVVLIHATTFASVHQYIPADHLVAWRQLLYSRWGFGFSSAGLEDGLSFQIGIAHWIVLVFASIRMITIRSRMIVLALFVWLSLWLMTSSPLHLWSQGISLVLQFPWRLLIVPLFLIPLLIIQVPGKFFWALLITLAIYTNRNHIRINQPQFTNVRNDYFFQESTATATPGEFMPKPEISHPDQYFSQGPIFTISGALTIVTLTGMGAIAIVDRRRRRS